MKKLWFRRKRYGFGWYPCSWEGWLSLLVYFVLVALIIATQDTAVASASALPFFLLRIAALTLMLLWVAYRTGEKPR